MDYRNQTKLSLRVVYIYISQQSMDTIDQNRLKALDSLGGTALNKQLANIARLIGKATVEEIDEFEVVLDQYQGAHKQKLDNVVAKCRSNLLPLTKAFQKQRKASQTKVQTSKFSLWRCLGFEARQQQEEKPSILSSLKALDQLDENQMYKQMEEITKLIDGAKLNEINQFDMILDHYDGAHRRDLEYQVKSRRDQLKPYFLYIYEIKKLLQASMSKPSDLVKFQFWQCLGFRRTQQQEKVLSYLTRFNAIDHLKENSKSAQLTAMARLIAHSTPKEINDIEMALQLYEGPHKQNFEKNIAKRKDQLRPLKYIEAMEREDKMKFQLCQCLEFRRRQNQQEHPTLLTYFNALDQLDRDELGKQLQVLDLLISKASYNGIKKFYKAFLQYEGPHQQQLQKEITRHKKIYQSIGQKDSQSDKLMQFKIKSKSKAKVADKQSSQKEHISKPKQKQVQVQQQTEQNKLRSRSKIYLKEVQNKSAIKNIHRTQNQKQASLPMLQRQEQQSFLSGDQDSVVVLDERDLKAKQEMSDKDQKGTKSKLKIK